MFQAQANRSNQPVKLPWRAINQGLATAGAPSVDINSFGVRYDEEDPAGPLHNIVNGDRDSFSNAGIILLPDNTAPDLVNNQEVDQGHDEVEKMANHQLKSKSK